MAPPKAVRPRPRAATASDSPTPRLSAPQRRDQLIEVAVDLFSRKGFNGTTTREIAAAAGVTEAVIFRHFETKEDLYTAIIDRRLNSPDAAKWVAELRAVMDRNDDEAVIRLLLSAIISTHKSDPRFERLMLYAALEGNQVALLYAHKMTASIVEGFRTYFARRRKQGRLRAIPPDAALAAIAGMARCYALDRYVHGFKEQCLSDEQVLASFTSIAMKGLCLPGKAEGSAKTR